MLFINLLNITYTITLVCSVFTSSSFLLLFDLAGGSRDYKP